MEPRISIITLGVTDLPRSVEFYRDGLGLTLYDDNTESIAFFQNRGTWLALYPRESLAADVGISRRQAADFLVSRWLTMYARGRRWTHCWTWPLPPAPRWSSRHRTPSGAVTPDTSPTRRVTCGKSPGTPTFG